MQDIEALSFEKATWIPLAAEKEFIVHGKFGTTGFRKCYRNIESLIVPLALKDEFKNVDWQSTNRNGPDSAWADSERFIPPACHHEDERVRYPVIQRWFESCETKEWDIFQEPEVGLELLRRNDIWIRPDENDIEVAKLERNKGGKPVALLFRAEHLRDYLCAKKATLLLTLFEFRNAIEEAFTDLKWNSDRMERNFAHGNWLGTRSAIHEGGEAYGSKKAIIHMWRESVNPKDDVPEMPHPLEETAARSESFTVEASGRKLFFLAGKIWLKHWIAPATLSPRIRHDSVEARVHFQVENQEQKTIAGDALKEYRGWLWFKPSVMRQLLSEPKSQIKWYTENTGEIGPAPNLELHFGINRLGLVNILGYTMAELPEWAQKMWVAHNVGPDGGLSEELHMSQNLAKPANTTAPEVILWHNLQVLQGKTASIYGQPLLQQFPTEKEFFHRIHRFYCDSFKDVCMLCKELHRIVSEPIDKGLLNSKIDPANAQKSKDQSLGSNKRLALWLDTLGLDGRKTTQPLAGVYDFRLGDAHIESGDLRKSLALFNIPPDNTDYQPMCCEIIGQVANCIHAAVNAIPKKQLS
jgi:hypothetical protein